METGSRVENRRQYDGDHCLFIIGANTADYQLTSVKRALEDRYGGAGNVRVFNSVVTTDRSQPRRFRQQAAFVVNSIRDGHSVDVIVHSLGANEFAHAIGQIERFEPGFFDDPDNAKKVSIRPIGPGGMTSNFREGIEYALRTLRLREHFDIPLLSKSRTLLRGLDSLIAFPLRGVEDLSEKIAEIMSPESSNIRDGVNVVPFIPKRTNEKYLNTYLSEDQLGDLAECDIELRELLSTNAFDHDRVRELVIRRGEIVRPAITKIFETTFEDRRMNAKGEIIEPIGPSTSLPPHVGNIEGLLVFFSLFGNKTLKAFIRLAEKGVTIRPLQHEFDVIQPIDSVLKLFRDGDDLSQLTVVRQRTHFDPRLQPESFVDSLKY